MGAFFIAKKEKEQTQMKFKNKNHQALFNTAATKLNRHDKTKMALLYLLTADIRLWNMAKHHVKKGYIDLDSIDLGNKGYPKAYTLLGVAKDIANGTSYLSINDLADPDVITPKMYGIIITAIGINRNGITSRKNNEKENENA